MSSQSHGAKPRLPIPRHWLLALLGWLGVSAAAFGLATYQAHRIEREAEASALSRAEVAAQAIEQNLLRVLEATESLHEQAQARQKAIEAGDGNGARLIEAQLASVARRGRFGVLQVGIIGPDGWLAWSSVPDWPSVNLSDREHFQAHRENGPGLFVSAPLVGRASGQWSVQFARRLTDQAGGFAGVAVVSVDPVRLSGELGELGFGTVGSIIVLRRDGVVIARSREASQAMGFVFGPNQPLMAALATSSSGSFRVARIPFEARPKLVGYRAIADTPLVVAVALDTGMELAPVAFVRPAFQGTATAISLLTLAVSVVTLLWLDRRRTQADLDLARQEREAALEQLAHTQRMEALGRLAGGVAHDFNNVLQTVLGGARLIERRPEDTAAVKRLASMISEAANRGASVTRRLLAFARRGELRTEIVDANALLAGLREVLTHTLGADIKVRIEADDPLPPVLADPGHLETVLVNLAVNARDAMAPLGGGELRISAEREEVPAGTAGMVNLKPGQYLRLSVTDDGVGMDPATLARAVEPFFTTKPKSKGTGLGLAMAKGFAEQSGGAFRIESELGSGTTVTLWLPRAMAGAEPGRGEEAVPPALATPASPGRMRVLLVDDEALIRATLAEDLAAHGWSVSEAANGAAALERLDAGEAIDLLVTDLAMPGMDGLTLIREARRRHPSLPAVLITGHAGDAQAGPLATAAAGGPFALLRKPVSSDDLRSRAASLLHADRTALPSDGYKEPFL